MRRLLLALLLGVTPAAAAPAGWMHLSDGALSLDAPAGAALKRVAPQTWELHDRRVTLGVAFGPQVADADDAEPRRCYATEIVLFDGTAGVLRTTRSGARADCPEGYASLYVPPARRGEPAMFIWAWSEDADDLASVRAVIAPIRLARR